MTKGKDARPHGIMGPSNMSVRWSKKRILILSSYALLFVFAGLLQYFDSSLPSFWRVFCSYSAHFIFLALILGWAISIKLRIALPSVRRKLVISASLLWFWLFLRLVKYLFVSRDSVANRYLWYAYYVPECFVPPLSLLAVLGIERKSGKPIKGYWYFLLLPALFFSVMVFTNDLHQWVFSFAPGFADFSSAYHHEWLFYLIMVWMVSLTLSSLIILFMKCRVSACRKKVYIPLAVFVLCFAFCLLCFLFDAKSFKIPELLTFSFVLLFESCIGIGLIPSNAGYFSYFELSKADSLITDKELSKASSTPSFPALDKSVLQEAQRHSLMLNEDSRLSCLPISGGYLFHIEDLGPMNRLNDQLQEANEMLSEEAELKASENEIKERLARIEKKNSLYGAIIPLVSKQLSKAKTCVDEARENPSEYGRCLRRASFFLAYIKRRSNLEIISSASDFIDVEEVALSIRETLKYWEALGGEADLKTVGKGKTPSKTGIVLYEFLQECLESSLRNPGDALVVLSMGKEHISLRVALSGSDLAPLCLEKGKWEEDGGAFSYETEEGTAYATLSFLRQGGPR